MPFPGSLGAHSDFASVRFGRRSSGAIFLILDLAMPFSSVMRVARARRAPRHPSLIFFPESDLPINVSRLFYREMGGGLFLGALQASVRWDPRASSRYGNAAVRQKMGPV